MEHLIIALVALIASTLTFFSGFGLGTLLLPAFALFFPLELAIVMTAIVHFLNNLFKLIIVKKKANRNIIIQFGIPAVIFSFAGSYLLNIISKSDILYSYTFFNNIYDITIIKICIGLLLFVFALLELIPSWSSYKFNPKYITIGGILSGFFGGLSGHQGALRSAFLSKLELDKESFIATGIVIACGIDIVRLLVYSTAKNLLFHASSSLVLIATVSAFTGAYIGNKFLKKITITTVQKIIGVLLILYAIFLISGII